jgi:NTP-dependent ternary system trypsin peptidase co-occuring protein
VSDIAAYSSPFGDILVEVDTSSAVGQGRVARRPGDLAVDAGKSFDAAVDAVRPAAASIVEKLMGLPRPPDEASVQFGLKLSLNAGAIIASSSAEGNFTVTLTWRRVTLSESGTD